MVLCVGPENTFVGNSHNSNTSQIFNNCSRNLGAASITVKERGITIAKYPPGAKYSIACLKKLFAFSCLIASAEDDPSPAISLRALLKGGLPTITEGCCFCSHCSLNASVLLIFQLSSDVESSNPSPAN